MFNQDFAKLYAPYPLITGLMVALAGCLASVATFIIGSALSQFIIGPALCQSAGAQACANSTAVSLHIASIIGGVIGVTVLIRANVYRPLLVVVATLIATWPLYTLIATFPWYIILLGSMASTVFAYGVFSWLLRLYNFLIASVLMLIIIALALFVTTQ